MAEREGTGSFDRKRAVSLLQEATRLITEFSGESQNARSVFPQSVSDTRTETLNANMPSTSSGVGMFNRERADRTLGNFRNLFAPYGNMKGKSTSSSVQSAHPPSKRRKPNVNGSWKRESWTHVFFCLANSEQCVPPTASLKTKLQEAGLGRKKVYFHYQASAVDFQTRLEEVYPKLKESGGFEILRRGSQTSDLVLIQPPRSGYSVPFLRDASDLGQAIAFIRPIQNNLDITPTQVVNGFEVSFKTLLVSMQWRSQREGAGACPPLVGLLAPLRNC